MSPSPMTIALVCFVLGAAHQVQGLDASSVIRTSRQQDPEVVIAQNSETAAVIQEPVANMTSAQPPPTSHHPLLTMGLTMANAGVLVVMPMLLFMMWKAPNQPTPGQDEEDMSIWQALPSVIVWASLGVTLVCFNKYLLLPVSGGGFGFPCPVALTWWHMCTGLIATCAIRVIRPELMPAVHEGKVSFHSFLTGVVPIGAVFGAYLAVVNCSYTRLSVTYIQMLGQAAPMFAFGVSVAFGLEQFTPATVMPICIVLMGVAETTVGEGAFSLVGFMLQIGTFVLNGLRMVLIKRLLSSHGTKLDPLSGLYYYCPVCVVMLLGPVIHFEGSMVLEALRHAAPSFFGIMVLNGLVAFSLNLSLLLLMAKTSATTVAMSSVISNVILTFGSAMLFHNSITHGQVLGYFSAMVGVKLWDQMKAKPDVFNKAFGLGKGECMPIARASASMAVSGS